MPFPFLPGETPPAERWGEGPQTWPATLTATTTNPNLGADGSADGWWIRVGRNFIHFEARFLFSGTGVNAGSGVYEIPLPLPPDMTFHAGGGTFGGTSIIGSGVIRDQTTPANNQSVQVTMAPSGTAVRLNNNGSTSAITSTTPPFTWADGDRISISGDYVIVAGS